MKKKLSIFSFIMICIFAIGGCGQNKENEDILISPMEYPLTKEAVEEAFEQVDLPGAVSEETYDSAIRTSLDIRDEEGRLIAGIASNGDGEKRFLGITLVGYLRAGAASVYLPEDNWEDIVGFATLLAGFEDKSIVYKDFIENYEETSIITEYQREEELYYEKQYEWLKSYGDISCQIEVNVATDGTKEISTIAFYNTPEYSTQNSEMAAKNFLYYIFTSNPARYDAYVNATDGKYNPINIDEAFLESDYSAVYLNQYKDRATENCLQNMESSGYFTMVDYFAEQAGSQVCFVNAVLTESDEVNGDKDVKSYLYTANLTSEKDGEVNEFTVQGSISVANQLNGWKVYDFLLSDKEALSMYITGDSVYRTDQEVSNETEAQEQSVDNHEELTDAEMLETFQTAYGWDCLENQELFWNAEDQRVVINYYFSENAEEWQMDSAREYGLKTFVFKQYLTISSPQPYQMWSYGEEIKEVVIQVFSNGTMLYKDIYGGIENGIVKEESHYGK